MPCPNREMTIPAGLPMVVLAVLFALPACSSTRHPTGSANLTVQPVGAVDLDSAIVTVSGPAMPTAKSYPLSPRGNAESWGGIIGPLPVGNDYQFEVAGKSQASTDSPLVGSASGVAITTDQVPDVVIAARRAVVRATLGNSAPIIDSLVLSSTYVAPSASTTVEVTVHDADPDDTITLAWSSSPVAGGFSQLSSAATTWTAPPTAGDQTLVLTATDDQGASTSASVVVHVTANPDEGGAEADVEVTLNDWPVVTNVLASPSTITFGAPIGLTVTASDDDGDTLSYLWASSCLSGRFSSTTAPVTTFTLPAGATNTSCDFVVSVNDGRGGSTTGQTTLPVGQPTIIVAPVITTGAQSVSVVDPDGNVNLTVHASDPQGSPLTFQWVAPDGTLSNQVNSAGTSNVVWTAPATTNGDFTVTAIVTDSLGASVTDTFPVFTSGPAPPPVVAAVPIPRFACWLLAGALAIIGTVAGKRRQRYHA